MATSNNNDNSGVRFVGMLTVAFIVLKLTEVIDWSWWWVVSPLWITAAIVGGLVLVCLVAALFTKK